MKNRVVIIGGGFAGVSAALKLSRSKKDIQIVLVDKKEEFNFLPMLPDVLGRAIKPEFLTSDLRQLSKKRGFEFIKEEVASIDLEKRLVHFGKEFIAYDYLVLACGSETNFYGNGSIKKYAYKLDSVSDAGNILEAIAGDKYDNWIIGGGGYTGIEVATNLRRYFDKYNMNKRIIILEKANTILGSLPEWMKKHALNNLRKLNIEVILNNSVKDINEEKITFSDAGVFDKAILIWAAGVKTADFISDLKVEKNNQGRIKVNEYLEFRERCFAVGDAANFYDNELALRMAVQFSIAEGEIVAKNIINSISGSPLRKYKPLDLGYVIPMANNNSCGRIFGVNMKGVLPTFMHYIMCIYRSMGARNKLGIITCLLKGGAQ